MLRKTTNFQAMTIINSMIDCICMIKIIIYIIVTIK